MEQQERLIKMKAALVDFLVAAYQIPHLVSVILFGSLLEGDVNKKSDIDLVLLFDTPDNPEIGEELKAAIKISGEIIQKYNLENSFGFVAISLQRSADVDSEFLKKIASEGVTVWERDVLIPPQSISSLSPKFLFEYTTQNLNPKQRVSLHRKLYGYKTTTRQKGKEYQVESIGIIGKYGRKIRGNALLIEVKNAQKVEEIFKKYNLSFKKHLVWE